MGKNPSKKSRSKEKFVSHPKEPKLPGLPKPPNPSTIAAKAAQREKKMDKILENLGNSQDSHTMKNMLHARWPALFKIHIGIIEAHIKSLDRLMMSMKAEMALMKESQRREWELGERGNWRVICEMMDRAREVLIGAKVAAKGILPEERLKDKKNLGVIGKTYEPLGPKLAAKAAELGYTKKGKLGRDPNEPLSESESDSDSEDSEDEEDEAEKAKYPVAEGSDFISLGGKKKDETAKTNGGSKTEVPIVKDLLEGIVKKKAASSEEPVAENPYFFVDTEPTPVKESKSAKKKRLAEEGAGKKAAKKARLPARENGTSAPAPAPTEIPRNEPVVSVAATEPAFPDIDFKAIEAQLQAEINEATIAQEAAKAKAEESTEEVKSKRKRRRSSDGTTEILERKVKKDKKENDKKRKADEVAAVSGEEVEGEEAVKKPKERKDKKRKAEDSGDVQVEVEKKKKRKHRVEEVEEEL